MQIKTLLGKLKIALPLADLIRSQQQTNNIQILPIELEHVLELKKLPAHHHDPFDRLLIVQAKAEGALLVSKDKVFNKYKTKLLW
jgi:PIN domain nuclease of toxin-antitoxin system